MSAPAVMSQEAQCPRCRARLPQKHALGLKPAPLAPGEFQACPRCGSMLVMNLDRSLRFATRAQIDDEVRMHPFFHTILDAAERTRRQFIAARSGFETPATLQKRSAAKGGH